jgi:SAM-dependent methyltransferase
MRLRPADQEREETTMSVGKNGLLGNGLARWPYDEASGGGPARPAAPPSEALRAEAFRAEALREASGAALGRPSPGNFKRVAMSAVDCALAHWYLVPGLAFQRARFGLGLKSLLGRGRLPRSVRALILQQTPAPAAYLGFHFAARFLSRDTLGSYLDVSSPWLFPFTMLSRRRAASATLLSDEAAELRSLMEAAQLSPAGGLRCAAADTALAGETYDTITSLCDAGGGVKHDARAVRNLWHLLKPGGTLLLSVPCIKACSKDGAGAGGGRLYDARALEREIFAVLGQPRRYAIYGAQTPSRHGPEAPVDGAAIRWGAAAAIGRDWRCYARLQELPGEGVMVMKFNRPERLTESNCAAFASRLT